LQFDNTPELSFLSDPFTEKEVRDAIFDIHPEKAPGPDGFTGLFFRSCWDLIKSDLLAAIHKLQTTNCQHLRKLNSATMILIPKFNGANKPKDFRPISLIHSFAKIISKVMATRLQPVMPALVLPCQNAFIKGRNIHDNFVYVQSLAKALKQKKIPSLLLKLDISKAFDTVSWEFLLQLLQHRGFPQGTCNLLSILLQTSSTQILVNGELSEKLLHRRGLRQGDPLSPLLFVLVMDCLARLFSRAHDSGLLQPLGNQQLTYRTSLYADDVMIFLKPAEADLLAAHRVLSLFGEATGLHPNFNKSSLIPIRCEELNINTLLPILDCPLGSFPCKYLGMPLSDSRLKRDDYQPIIDSLISKFSGWKIGWIAIAGRLVLVRVVLSAIPTFQMLAIAHPKWLDKIINRIRRSFLWVGECTATGSKCLVRWSSVCRPTENGGLGIHDLAIHGHALRMRWLWQNQANPDKPWHGLPFPSDTTTKSLFIASTRIIIGNGASTSFWHAHWLDAIPLKTRFPSLFKHSKGSRLCVRDAIENGQWIQCIKPNPTVQVLTDYLHLANQLTQLHLNPTVADTIRWKWTANGVYSARSAYQFQFLTSTLSNFNQLIWNTKIPPKIQFFAWLAIQGRCSTADILLKKHIQCNPICSLCHIHPETAVHLLGQCSFSGSIWSVIFGRYVIASRRPSPLEPSLEQWWLEEVTNKSKADATKLSSVIMCTWWRIWKERNNRIFNAKACNALQICDLISEDLRDWKLAGLKGAIWAPD